MSDFTINDSTWQGTFPQLVSPLADEWLPGLLLRCDRANGWNSGITQSFIRLSYKTLYQLPETYVFAVDLDLEALARYLALPSPSILLETTFRPALWGLYSTDRIDPSKLGVANLVQICPACIEDSGLIQLCTALSSVIHCPIHKLAYQHRCSCGTYLRWFHPAGSPFRCFACGWSWSALPRIPGDPSDLAEEARHLALYKYFLTERTQLAYRRVLDWAAVEKQNWFLNKMRVFFNLEPVNTSSFNYPLHALITDLVDLGFSPHDVALNTLSLPKSENSCLNHACPMFARTDGNHLVVYGSYQVPLGSQVPIWCCLICGSCWFNHRLCLTFDEDCASDDSTILYPSPPAIHEAQKQLKKWKDDLDNACLRIVKRGKMISIEQAFKMAHIPLRPNLLAPRLGLLQIVSKYIFQQQNQPMRILDPDPGQFLADEVSE